MYIIRVTTLPYHTYLNNMNYNIFNGNQCSRLVTLYNKPFNIISLLHSSLHQFKEKGKGMVLYSAVSSLLDRSKRFTLSSPGRPVHSDTVLGFSWKHSSHAAIAQRLFTHISTTVYSQVLIYTAESTEAS